MVAIWPPSVSCVTVAGFADHVGERSRRASEQRLKVLTVGLEVTAGDRRVDRGHKFGRILVETGLLERIPVLLDGQIAIPDVVARKLRNRLGQLEQVERLTSEFVRAIPFRVLKKGRDSGDGIVLPGGGRDSAATGGADNSPRFEVLRQAIRVVLRIPTVAQHDKREARLTERPLGL